MPTYTVEDAEAIQRLRKSILEAADKAARAIRDLAHEPSMSLLAHMKFQELGFHPIDDRRLNLVEQINQTFTYLVSLAAAEYVLAHHSDATPIQLNLGTTAGYDLVSPSAGVAAEVFAAVNRTNNRKLAKDLVKVSGADAPNKYVFFHCPGESPGSPHLDLFPQVQLVALSAEAVWGAR
jgi:hypothetical protein